MGEILLKYYKYVAEKKGLPGKVALAQTTKIPSTQAATEPDNQQNIELFRQAIREITGQAPPEY